MDLDVLKVKFTHSNTVRDKKPYTIYEIEVRSSSTITWVIYKRYSSFHQLHQDLMKSPLISPEQKLNLPQLPPKRLTRSLAVEFVEKRKNELQDYLRAMLETPGLVHSPVILAFLEVPDSVRPMLAAAANNQQIGGNMGNQAGGMSGFDLGVKDYIDKDGLSSASSASSKLSYASKTPDERRILDLINLLKYHPNKVSAIKNFEDWFFENRPRLNQEFIRLLLQGKSGSETDGGLIQTIGEIGYSHVASRAALYLLCRLLDVEKNKDAHLFLEQFVSFDALTLKQMQMNEHIISERGNRIGAFKIIHILRNTPSASSSTGRTDSQLEAIVNDQWALREYFKWADRKSDTSGQIVPFNHTTSQNKDYVVLKSLNLAPTSTTAGTAVPSNVPTGPNSNQLPGSSSNPSNFNAEHSADLSAMRHLRARISDIFQDLKKLAEEKEIFVGASDGSPLLPSGLGPLPDGMQPPPVLTPQQQREGVAGWRIVNLVQQFDAQNRPIPIGNMNDAYDEDVAILYKTVKNDIVIVKVTCLLPYRMEEVAPYLADLRRRREWDLKYHKGTCLEIRSCQEYQSHPQTGQPISLQYPEYQTDVVHMVFKSFSSPYKYRDVVVLRSFAAITKTRAEFEAKGYRQHQILSPSTVSTPTAASSHTAGTPSYSDVYDSSISSNRDVEEPLLKEGFFQDGGMVFATRSVIHPAGPELKDNVRAVLYPSGYILTPLRDQGVDIHPQPGSGGQPVYTNEPGGACKLTFLTQMDRESVLIVSPDLLGENNELRHSYNNIKACLARDCGLRTLRSSVHTQHLRLFSGRPDPISSVNGGGTATRAGSIVMQDLTTPASFQHRQPGMSESEQTYQNQRTMPPIMEQR